MRLFISALLLLPAASHLLFPGMPPEVSLSGLPASGVKNPDMPSDKAMQTMAAGMPMPKGWPSPPNPDVAAPSADIVEKEVFCADTPEKQASGYLSAGKNASYFFWFVRSKQQGPRPLLLWLSGGPGCSSSLAFLVENGPCELKGQHADGSWKWHKNPHSWTKVADVLWVDQPSNVGYSAGENISKTEADVGEHMYIFLQSFFARFPELRSSPFFITGESFGGHYIPAVATKVLREIQRGTQPPMRLDGAAIGNGLVDPFVQFTTSPEMAYTGGAGGSMGHGVVNKTVFDAMEQRMPACKVELRRCQASKDFFKDCAPAMMDCMGPTITPISAMGLNPYDLRKHCPKELQPMCVNISDGIRFMNDPNVQDSLGVAPHRKWLPCSMVAGIPFHISGDSFSSTAPLVAELLAGGVPVLAYYGDADFMCHWVGGKDWALQLNWPQRQAWAAADDLPWMVDGVQHGKARSLGGFTFLQIFDSGHMVPMDQPEAALAMMNTFMTKGNEWDMPLGTQTEDKLSAALLSQLPSLLFLVAAALVAVASTAVVIALKCHRRRSSARATGSEPLLN